jgi:hypothetical protein
LSAAFRKYLRFCDKRVLKKNFNMRVNERKEWKAEKV